ncbi:MAG: hypothetical protein ACLRMZ_11040 [Blautia marasmi]
MAVILVYFLVQYGGTGYHLVESVRGGGREFTVFESVFELDELHKVIENLTDTQMQTENQLLEKGALSDCGRKFPDAFFNKVRKTAGNS